MTYVLLHNMITSRQNIHFKDLKLLQKKRVRDEKNLFLVEGKKEISHILPEDLVCVYTSNAGSYPCQVIDMSAELIEAATYRGGTAIAVVKKRKKSIEGLSCFVVADGVEKPGNLGAIMRTADAAGFEGVVTIGDSVDIYSPNVIRASLGAFFTQRVVQSNAEALIAYCVENEITLFVATPEASTSLYETKFPKKSCIVIGSESCGASAEIKKAASSFGLPMYGKIDSLNASTAFGIIAYEFVRQRHFT